MKNDRYKKNGREVGFSLLDLLVVLLLFFLAIGSVLVLTSSYNKFSLLKSSQQLTDRLIGYQLLASQREDNLKVFFENREGIVYQKDSKAILERFFLPKEVSVEFKSKEKNTIYFYSSGVVSPTTIHVIRKNVECQIVISMRGRIRNLCQKKEK